MCLCYLLLFCAAAASAPLSPLTTTTIYRIGGAHSVCTDYSIWNKLASNRIWLWKKPPSRDVNYALHFLSPSPRHLLPSASCGLWFAIPPMHTLHREVEWNRFMTATKTAYALLLTLAAARRAHVPIAMCVCVCARANVSETLHLFVYNLYGGIADQRDENTIGKVNIIEWLRM